MKTVRIACDVKDSVKLDDLVPFQGNLKSLTKEDYGKLRREILETGFAFPVFVWKAPKGKRYILGGHQRVRALLELRDTEGYKVPPVPVVFVAAKTAQEAKRRVLQDVAQYGHVERQGLYEFMAEAGIGMNELAASFTIPAAELDMNGFQMEFFADPKMIPSEDEADQVPEPPKKPKVKKGDLWRLGEHRLFCGDSTVITDVDRLMGGEKAQVVFTDPPYNIAYKPGRGTHEAIENDDMDPGAFRDFLTAMCSCLVSATVHDSYAFIWSGWSTIDQFAPVLKQYYTLKAMPIWVKHHFGMGWYSRPKYEPFFLCLRGEPPKPQDVPADVWEHNRVMQKLHSCEKPVGLIEAILAAYCPKGSVLDLFGGSGSTLIACERTSRKSFVMEIDPIYSTVIIDRWTQYTGQEAYLLQEDGSELAWSNVNAKGRK